MTVILAVAASLMWGTSDFVGGSKTRQMGVTGVLFASQLATLPIALCIYIVGQGWNSGLAGVGWAAAAGASGVVGLAALYKALASGHMGIVAPVSACGVVVPVVVGLAGGDRLSGVVLVGILCITIGVVACAKPMVEGSRLGSPEWHPLSLALLSAVAFGITLVCLAHAGHSSVFTSLLVMRSVSLLLIGTVAVRRRLLPSPRTLCQPSMLGIGCLDLAANACYAFAGRSGEISIIGVLASLYPVVTALLARQVLGERLGRTRGVGLVITLTGLAFIGAAQVGP